MPAYRWDAGAYIDLQTGEPLVLRTQTVAIIGDSLTAQSPGETALRGHLTDAGWDNDDIYWNAVSGRWLVAEDDTGQTTLTVIDDARATLPSEPLWVIALGTNGRSQSDGTTDTQLDQILAKLGAGARVLWINLALMDPDDADVARRNARLDAMQARHPDKDITVADWKSFIHAQPNQSSLWNVNDGIHYSGTGSALRQQWVAEQVGPPGGDPGYLPGWGTPVWRDEFTSDTSQWNVRNNFLTFDTARAMTENVTVEGGQMHLLGTWLTPVQAAGPQGVLTHNTGYVDTRNLSDAANPSPKHFSQRYGRWEVRCQVPTGENTRGALAAFWLRCDSHPGEIDIMEAWGGGGTMASDWTNYIKGSATTTIHSSTTSSTVNGKPYKKTFWRMFQHGMPRNAPEGMRSYWFEYTPNELALGYDDYEMIRVTPSSPDPENAVRYIDDPDNPGGPQIVDPNYDGTLAWLWDEDFFGSAFHMRMNLHVGPSASYWGLPDDNNRQWTVDPLDFAIEHVRVWEYKE